MSSWIAKWIYLLSKLCLTNNNASYFFQLFFFFQNKENNLMPIFFFFFCYESHANLISKVWVINICFSWRHTIAWVLLEVGLKILTFFFFFPVVEYEIFYILKGAWEIDDIFGEFFVFFWGDPLDGFGLDAFGIAWGKRERPRRCRLSPSLLWKESRRALSSKTCAILIN